MDYTELVKHMSLREQARLVTGADYWHTWESPKYGLPSIMVSDGPTGLRKEIKDENGNKTTVKATCFPSATALAASWDREVMAAVGSAIADECIANRVSVLLGPGVNIKRSPLCGRNFEYYSEDPVHAGELASAFINAVQDKGVGTSLKHFAANSTEVRRMMSNSIVDERALREIYLKAFEIAVTKSQPWTVMLAYNKLNGKYCTENAWLVENVLRGEWGFSGLTVSDWMATNDRVEGLVCGLDLEMPGSNYINVRKLAKGFRKGLYKLEALEESATRVANLVNKSEAHLKQAKPEVNLEANHALASKVAEQCAVLLKNEGVLPIPKGTTITVIGERAEKPMYQGYGSAQINSYKVENVVTELGKLGFPVAYCKGYEIGKDDVPNQALINQAVATAKMYPTALIFLSCNEIDACEAADRQSMSIPAGQAALVDAVCAANPNTAVILTSGSCLEMPWVNTPRTILQTYLLGEGGASALANIIAGNISPSGKLPESYPVSFADTPCPNDYQTDENNNVIYRESIFVGYRYFEKQNVPVLFPFGHGLTYTSFDYKNLRLSSDELTPSDKLTLTFTLSNVGSFNAGEVVQVYVGLKDSYVFRAPKELKAFTKVFLNSGMQQEVSIELDRSAFEYYSKRLRAWVVEKGTYDIYIGSSSSDIRLTATVDMMSTEANDEIDYATAAPVYFDGAIKEATDEDFEGILGAYLDDFKFKSDDRFTSANCLADFVSTKQGKIISDWMETIISIFFEDKTDQLLYYNSLMTLPLCRIPAVSNGIVSDPMVDAIVHFFNSGSVLESLEVAACGIPSTILNIVEPLIRDKIEKKSRCGD